MITDTLSAVGAGVMIVWGVLLTPVRARRRLDGMPR